MNTIQPMPSQDFTALAALYFLQSGDYLFKDFSLNGTSSKFVTAHDVRAAFGQKESDSGWIRPGIIRSGWSAKGRFFAYVAPVQKVTIRITAMGDENGAYMLPIPSTLLIGAGSTFFIRAIKAFKGPQTRLFHAPFPNVWDNGRICWGANTAPKADPGNPEKAWNLFFDAAFNADLAGSKAKSYNKDVRVLLVKLARENADAFPEEELVSADTVEQICDAVLTGDVEE